MQFVGACSEYPHKDQLYMITPFAFGPKSPVLARYLELMSSTVLDTTVDLATVQWAKPDRTIGSHGRVTAHRHKTERPWTALNYYSLST